MRRELYRLWIISHCCGKVSHKPTSRCFVLITMQVEAFLSTRRTNRVFRSCFVHMFQTTTLGTGTFAVVLVIRGRAGGSRRGLHGPRWRRGRRRGRHDAPRHAGGKAQLLAFHHIEGTVERYDDLALAIGGITGRAFAVCLTIRRGGRFLFRGMSTATATAGTGFGPAASARLSRVGANIVRHGISHRLGE